MPMSILSQFENRPILATLVQGKIKVLDTYGVIVSSPKQFDLDSSDVKVTHNTAHWILKT